MGYYSRVQGEWTITPPLNGRELRAIPVNQDVFIRVDESDRETDEGVLTVKQGVAVACSDDEQKFYELKADLHAIVRAMPLDRTLTGQIVRIGEENGDVERYLPDMESATVKTERAELRWPDGAVVDI